MKSLFGGISSPTPARERWGILAICLIASILRLARAGANEIDRSPIDLVLGPKDAWLVTANQTSDSLSLVDIEQGRVLSEVSCGDRPAGLALSPDGARLVASSSLSGELRIFEVTSGPAIRQSSVIFLGFEPRGVVISPDSRRAYVALHADASIAVVDLDQGAEIQRIRVGRWPRQLALSPDGNRLAVGTSGDQSISVVDTQKGEMLFQEKFGGINVGHLIVSQDGQYAYFPWMIYRQNPIDARNIQAGWVLGSRIARVRLAEQARREAMTLDPQGKAVSDPHGIAMTRDENWLLATGSGTHELLVYKTQGLVLQDVGGPGDHIDPMLARNPERHFRVDLGGRPMGLRVAQDDQRVFVANYLSNSVQIVDLKKRTVVKEIELGGAAEPTLARRGEAIFLDGKRSLDQWYSCQSCHYDRGPNAVVIDTFNDGTPRTFKTVLSLRNVAETGPWTWHGWQTDLRAAMHKSLTETMLGPAPTDDDVDALIAYLKADDAPRNPRRLADGGFSEAATRGKAIFESSVAACSTCHSGEFFTDGKIHDVGLGSAKDAYKGYNTPSLVGLYQRVRFLHDGRGRSLEDILRGPHSPEKVSGERKFTDSELVDLVEYLNSL